MYETHVLPNCSNRAWNRNRFRVYHSPLESAHARAAVGARDRIELLRPPFFEIRDAAFVRMCDTSETVDALDRLDNQNLTLLQ